MGRAGARSMGREFVWLAFVPTCVTVTVSMPWPTLSMSSRILSPAEMSATDVTLMLVAPAGASARQVGLRARLADRGDRGHLVLLHDLWRRRGR